MASYNELDYILTVD